jgi:hypothetical protein
MTTGVPFRARLDVLRPEPGGEKHHAESHPVRVGPFHAPGLHPHRVATPPLAAHRLEAHAELDDELASHPLAGAAPPAAAEARVDAPRGREGEEEAVVAVAGVVVVTETVSFEAR